MSIKNAGAAIREVREKAGLSREKMSDGICSVQSLYRIETGTAGVSPSTFHALMTRAGAPCEALPVFANRTEFDCFLALKHIRQHLDAWQLTAAYEDLQKVEQMQWGNNKYYYQEWLLHHCRLQLRSGKADHEALKALLLDALHMSLPDFHPTDIPDSLFTVNEIDLLLLFAQESLYSNELNSCLLIYRHLSEYVEHSRLSNIKKARLQELLSIVDVQYFIAAGDYPTALEKAQMLRRHVIYNRNDGYLLGSTFLTGLCYYHCGDPASAIDMFETAIFSAYALKSSFACIIINYLTEHTILSVTQDLQAFAPILYPSFPMPISMDWHKLSDGTYDPFAPDILTFGSLIRTLRTEQKVSQNTLCLGLCSKSKLSKIENGSLQPDLLLAEALIQRLGFSEREFCFWGTAKEARIQELKYELIHSFQLPDEQRRPLIEQLKEFARDNHPLVVQMYLYFSSTLQENAANATALLEESLYCTLPDFDLNQILDHRLTWIELSILNRLFMGYKPFASNYLGIRCLYYLDTYYRYTDMDILLCTNTHMAMLRTTIHCLYSAGRYQEAVDYFFTRPFDRMIYVPSFYMSSLFYASRAFGTCGQLKSAREYGSCAYYLEKLYALEENAATLERALFDDFGIRIKQI